MAKKGVNQVRLGSLAFIGGTAAVIFAGIFFNVTEAGWMVALLILLGLLVGWMNIKSKEVVPFLVASISLLISTVSINSVLKEVVENSGSEMVAALQGILGNVSLFVAPAAMIVSLKVIFALAEE